MKPILECHTCKYWYCLETCLRCYNHDKFVRVNKLFKIIMLFDGRAVDMPLDNGLHLIEACYRADLYKRRNESATFTVVNEDNGDIEYQV